MYDSAKLLDVSDPAVKSQLDELHPDPGRDGCDRDDDILPDEPDDLHTNDDYEYELGNITIDTDGEGGKATVDTLDWVTKHAPKGVAQGLSGARYEHYQILSPTLLHTMATDLLNGRTGEEAREVLTSCRGLALDKGSKEGGQAEARPIAIGEAIRRLASRCVLAQSGAEIAQELRKVMQFGIGTSGGIEYSYHAVRCHMMAMLTKYEEKISRGEQVAEKDIPVGGKADFRNGYNNTLRSRMLAQIEEKFPTLLRQARYNYAQRAKVVFMKAGEEAHIVESVFGSQQGDVLGGHYFALSIYDFAHDLITQHSEVMVTFIIDDLTLSGTQGELTKALQFVEDKGPQYGLFKHPRKGAVFSHVEDYEPMEQLRQLRYKHARHGWDKLLGAPLGTAEYEKDTALERVESSLHKCTNLKRLQDTQLEFLLLKYCLASKSTHLTRMLDPVAMAPALEHHEEMIRGELARIVSNPGKPTALDDVRWQLAKLPTKHGGMGLRDLPLVAPAQFAAAMGSVFFWATYCSDTLYYEPAKVVLEWFTDDIGDLGSQLEQLAADTNEKTVICPTIAAMEEMPRAKRLCQPLYAKVAEKIQKDSSIHKEDRAEILSGAQEGAGDWLQAVPSIKVFRATSHVYKTALQMRLCINPAFAEEVEQCKGCTKKTDLNMQRGRHWRTECKSGLRINSHDKLRDHIRDMAKECKMVVRTEVGGLYSSVDPDGSKRPADLLIAQPGQADEALDVCFGDPTTDTYIKKSSWKKPLVTAQSRHDTKMDQYNDYKARAGAQGLPFRLTPLAFETTGAMGVETQKWFKKMIKLNAAIKGEDIGETKSRMQQGVPCTWSANTFKGFWKQRISFFIAMDRASKTNLLIGESEPKTHRGWGTGG